MCDSDGLEVRDASWDRLRREGVGLAVEVGSQVTCAVADEDFDTRFPFRIVDVTARVPLPVRVVDRDPVGVADTDRLPACTVGLLVALPSRLRDTEGLMERDPRSGDDDLDAVFLDGVTDDESIVGLCSLVRCDGDRDIVAVFRPLLVPEASVDIDAVKDALRFDALRDGDIDRVNVAVLVVETTCEGDTRSVSDATDVDGVAVDVRIIDAVRVCESDPPDVDRVSMME